jgi:hypothetical protein
MQSGCSCIHGVGFHFHSAGPVYMIYICIKKSTVMDRNSMMIQKVKIYGITLCGLLCLFACAPIVYTLGGQFFPTANEALLEQRRQMDAILLKVDLRATPYTGHAVVFVPTDSDLRARGIVRTGTPGPAIENYVAAVNYRALAFFQEIVAKRKLFESVELRDVSGTARPALSPGEHGVWARAVQRCSDFFICEDVLEAESAVP